MDEQVDIKEQYGFENLQEMHELVTLVSLATQQQLTNFNRWKHTDGSKEGLLHVLGVHHIDGVTVYDTEDDRDRWFGYLRNKRTKEYHEDLKRVQMDYRRDLIRLDNEKLVAIVGTNKKGTG